MSLGLKGLILLEAHVKIPLHVHQTTCHILPLLQKLCLSSQQHDFVKTSTSAKL